MDDAKDERREERGPDAGSRRASVSRERLLVGIALGALVVLGLLLVYAASHWIVHGWLFEGLQHVGSVRTEAVAAG